MAIEYYYYGQGKVFSRPFGTVGRGGWRWWGDVSAVTLAAQVEKLQHRESYSGVKGIARDFPISTGLTLSATLHQLDTETLADMMYGTASDVAGGTVVGEVLGTVAPGDIVKLDFARVSSLAITDSAGTPATIAGSHYVLDPRFGSIEFLTLPTGPAPTFPLRAGYTHAGGKQLAFFNKPQPILEFRYEGVNLAEGNRPVIFELYRVGTDPLAELALINNDTNLAAPQISAAAQIDGTKPANGPLGQFGRMLQYTNA